MRFTYFWPGWAVALGIVIAVGVTTLVYLRIERPLQRRQTLLLIALRVCAVAILLGCLLAPVIIEKRDITPPMHLSVLVDTSQSMRLTDAGNLSRLNQINELLFGDSDTENERTLLHTLADRFEVHVYAFDTELHQVSVIRDAFGSDSLDFGVSLRNPKSTLSISTLSPLRPMGALTDIGTALQQVDAAWKGQQRAGIVLFTDGAHNAGELPMEALVALQMPVYALGVGAAEPPKDIQLQRVDVAPVAYTGHEQRVRVTVAQSGYTGQTTRLALREVNRQKVQRLVASTTLTFEEGSQQIEFTLTPETEGNFQYTLTLPTLDGELTSENNEKTFALKVVKAKLSVFYLEGRPRWEYTFLKRALERDPGIEFTSALLSLLSKGPASESVASESVLGRSDGYYPVGSNVNHLSARFPETREELSAYDVLIFGDVTAEHLTATQQRLIVDFVETEGNAIVFLSSRNALSRSGLRDTELARLMPISVPITGCSLSETEFTVQLTQAGAFHPMLQLSGYTGRGESAVANRAYGRRGGNLTPNRNAALWRNLPALSRLFHGFQLRGGATTLLETGLLETGRREPVMIFQRAGLGKSLLFAAEGLWNWDFGTANFRDARYHSLYREVWAQILRWMGTTHTDANRLYLTTDASTYATGDTVQVTAQVYSETYQPQTSSPTGATVQIEVTPPEGAPFQLRATTISEETGSAVENRAYRGENRYTARFEVREKGTYQIRATSGGGNTDKTEFYVQPQLAELEAPQLNEALLRHLASQTGGAYFAIADAAQLPENIAFVQDSVFVDTERDVWAHPLVLILVVGLLGTEWFLRKRNGFL